MGIFSKNKKSGEIVAVFDIGSGSVGGALVELLAGEKPKVIFSCREDMVFQDEFKFERFLSSMLSSIDVVLKNLRKNSNIKIKKVLCTFSAPWYVSQTRTLSFKSEKEMVVTRKKIDELVTKEVVELKKGFDEHYKNLTKSAAEIIEIETVNIKLNGYETSTPFGKSAKTIDAYLYVSMSSEHILSTVREKLHRAFLTKEIFFRSFALVGFSTMRDIYTDIQDFIFLDISREMSDISVVRNNTIVETLSFPLGQNFVLRGMASQLNTSPVEARSSLALYFDEKTAPDAKGRIKTVIDHLESEWTEEFQKNLLSLASYTVLPGKVFLITDTPFDMWFSHIMQHADYKSIPLMRDRLGVETIRADVLEKFVHGEGVADDMFISISAIFAHKIFESSG